MRKKQQVISKLFEICKKRNDFVFDNRLVKKTCAEIGFKNPYDVTKIDNSSILPADVREQDYFVIHLGMGNHQFVKGIHFGYHEFEPINDAERIRWKYRKSLLNEFDTSESNILSVANNQRILHDFLYKDMVASPKAYNSRRTKKSITYFVGDEFIETTNLQMEIDFTFEYHGNVTVIEAKNKYPEDFAVYQLFHPYKYYRQLKKEENIDIKQINSCYILRRQGEEGSVLRLYKYTFDDENQISSIRLVEKAEYALVKR
ncbi:MAG TPA: hypothetical protein G4N98_08340 [Thermoflexia bacterium]|nr:hypothetical protein [Thermoflexia bacterium]